jgi:hypothetical protein
VSDAARRLDALIDDYLAGRLRFMHFWTGFMDIWGDGQLSVEEETLYASAYDTVYMGAEGPVSRRAGAVGLLTEPEVRERLRVFRGASPRGAPA